MTASTGWRRGGLVGSERALYDLVQITGVFHLMNRFVEGGGLEAKPADFDR